MYTYDVEHLKSVFSGLIKENTSAEAFTWLNEKSATVNDSSFNSTFVSIPRKTGKASIDVTENLRHAINGIRKGLDIKLWAVDRLARVWLLLNLDVSDKDKYFQRIENLFLTAEVNELVALYSSLPLLAYPAIWRARCSEGIRNNIGDVLSTIMCKNPYPSENLDEPAWNQMILKAFFTEKPIDDIVGLDERANERLALTLTDYAHERWAAGRPVNPQLWRCVGPFINESILSDLKKLLSSESMAEQNAAALALYQSKLPSAKKLISPEQESAIKDGRLSWTNFTGKPNDYVLQQ
jgi:hypothetical protein